MTVCEHCAEEQLKEVRIYAKDSDGKWECIEEAMYCVFCRIVQDVQ